MTQFLTRWIFCLSLAGLLTTVLHAGETGTHFAGKGLKVDLVADVTAIAPGQTFHLGLWLRHDSGYHTYWKNPGLAGVPTRLNPTLPEGFKAGELIYPPPDKVKMAAINVHGYEHNVLIALPVTAPKVLPDGPVTIPVEATWMCCQRTCNPGHAKMSITLQTEEKSVPDERWLPEFKALQASQPPPATGWTFTATRHGRKEIEFTATPPKGLPLPPSPQFFSADNLICSHPVQNWEKTDTGYKVRLELSDFLPSDENHLHAVLSAKGSWLPDQKAPFVSLSIPITPAIPAP